MIARKYLVNTRTHRLYFETKKIYFNKLASLFYFEIFLKLKQTRKKITKYLKFFRALPLINKC